MDDLLKEYDVDTIKVEIQKSSLLMSILNKNNLLPFITNIHK